MGSSERHARAGSILGRRGAVVGIASALFLILCVLTVSSHYEPFFVAPTHNPPGPAIHLKTIHPIRPASGGPGSPFSARPNGHASHLVSYTFSAIMGVVALLLVILLAGVAARAVRRFHNPFSHFQRRRPDEGPIPDVLDEVTQAVSTQRSSLTVGTPRNAIIDAWISLEQSVEEAGVPLRASETSAELVIRVIDELDADSDALARLGRVYRRARYSSHEITEDDRAAARDALEALESSLQAASRARGSGRVTT
ncbi:DUF4129 domain-containing protein [Leekyejoonella antrihumi]|uniref:DUF4129 domain-containing protein n=1 Tax=Leekyejoonella antrihumi TaxID=1660198 RepID=A0A563E572_9MICO|nr:DUF4129 domain-containing protein [Leekyejoonella antrihumi]TWP37656.1 DUF4129 domain-containing protein [Leekyejoonella antrihumi]